MSLLSDRIQDHLQLLYPDLGHHDQGSLADRLIRAVGAEPGAAAQTTAGLPGADEVMLITYGDTLADPATSRPHLRVLTEFVSTDLDGVFGSVHVLPFFESSSDGGFSIIDYRRIAAGLGDWPDIETLAQGHELMVDLVCNHGSARSERFAEFIADQEPGRSWYLTVPDDADLSRVVRPRTHDLAVPVETAAGTRRVWATFSADQIDWDFSNPDVLVEFASIIGFYLDHGATRIRLDAIAYLWKQLGTECIHRPETHRVVKLFNTLVSARDPNVLLITETNVPHDQNVSYLGADEAQVVYNFTLAPLVVWSALAQDTSAINRWLAGLEPPPSGCTFLNFLASHDGLGLRPIEDLVESEDLQVLVDAVVATGGRVSTYSVGETERPYELNMSLADVLAGPDGRHADRFVAAHALMLALQGIPAIYIHSLLVSPGDLATLARTDHARDINRARLDLNQVRSVVGSGWRGAVFDRLCDLIRLRRAQVAFAPQAAQQVHDLAPTVVAVERSAPTGDRVLALHNLADDPARVELGAAGGRPGLDLVSGEPVSGESLVLGPWQVVWLTLHGQ